MSRGYSSYRHKGRYFVRYNHSDSHPWGLGSRLAATIPKEDPRAFNAWLENARAQLDADYEELKNIGGTDDSDDSNDSNDSDDSNDSNDSDGSYDTDKIDRRAYFVSDKQPVTDRYIDWVWEIDLDRLVFLVCAEPFFRLDHMPWDDVFLQCIGYDHYGHHAPIEETPSEYRYNWTAPPPSVEDAALEVYVAHKRNETSAATLLSAVDGDVLSDDECVHTQLLEVLVGNIMKAPAVGHSVRLTENVARPEELTQDIRDFAVLLPCLALLPSIFPYPDLKRPENVDAIWLRRDVVLRVTTHLDDERNMQAGIAALVSAIMSTTEGEGIVYGVVFSIFHCVLVRVDMNAGGSFDHTPALQFLPSFYAKSPSTPGITALARLGFRYDPDIVERTAQWLHHKGASTSLDLSVSSLAPFKISPAPDITALDRLPMEILEQIVGHISTRSADLLKLAQLSERCKSFAAMQLRAPFISDLQLTRAIPRSSPLGRAAHGDESTEHNNLPAYPLQVHPDESRRHDKLTTQSFAAHSDHFGYVLVHLCEMRRTSRPFTGNVLRTLPLEIPHIARDRFRHSKFAVVFEEMPAT
ncbi:hypothetical protein PLICRDRAFT_692919 [Plicaturopsis crispa FD-325 SS-3]|nr:hypothetical protein PLICRDRAFT_692919 [Plicaturopsis crispa FD-325 SS-3]